MAMLFLPGPIAGVTRFRPPIGPRDPELMKDLIRFAIEIGDNTPLVLIDPETARWIKEIDSSLTLVPDRNHFEYVYLASDLADSREKITLKSGVRRNKFRKNCPNTIEPITAENRKDVMEFLVKWCEWKGCENDLVLAHEKEAVFFAIEHFTELPLRGLMIRSIPR